MSSTAKTNNYNLPIFNATDKPTWMGDFNAAMNLIDTELKNSANGVAEAKEQVDLLEELVDDATATVGTLTARVAASEASVATLSADVVQNRSDIQTNAVNIAGNTTAINAHSVTITNQSSQIVQLNERLTGLNESLTVDTTDLSEDFSLNGLLQLLAEKYFPLFNGTIFKDGVITHGFELVTRIDKEEKGGVSITDDAIYGYASYSFTQAMFEVDLTNYTTLKFVIKSANGEATTGGVFDSNKELIANYYKNTTSTSYTTVTIDVSNLSGTYYVGGNAYSSTDGTLVGFYISEITLS